MRLPNSPDVLLEHPKRQRIYDAVQAHRAIHFRALCREVAIPAGTVRHHCNVLVRADLLAEARQGAMTLLRMPGITAQRAADVALLREPGLLTLYLRVGQLGQAFQKDVLAACAEWSRSTTQHRLDRLVRAGLLTCTPQGRLLRYGVA